MSNLVELISTGSSHATPGWAYVRDSGRSKTASGRPTGVRKRVTRDVGGSRNDLTSRQRSAILKHLADLDKENHKEVHIPVPARQKDPAIKGSRSKTTSNVRRILISQKSFKNHLDDDQANAGGTGPAAAAAAQRSNAARTAATANKSVAPSPKGSAPATPNIDGAVDAHGSGTFPPSQPHPSELIVSEFDNDPLLRSYIPSAPSERLMKALISEPPLSYNASRAKLPASSKPSRHFCGICGYWGKVKCTKCQARVCGLDCYRVHEETRCDRFYG